MANATCCACAAAEAATEEGSVAFAFAISFGAGMCTAVGGAMSFYGEIEDTRILAISLAVSAGVMIYVSFIEIFVKSVGGFTDQFVLDGNSQDDADRYAYYAATSFFFVGCMLTKLIDHGLGKIQERAAKETITGAEGICECEIPGTGYAAHEGKPAKLSVLTRDSDGQAQLGDADTVMSLFDQDKDGGLNTTELGQLVSLINADLVACAGGDDGARPAEIEGMGRTKAAMARIGALEAAKLQQMGLFTALSIFIHNFPEGLATFIATLADPAAGVALGVAVGVHNIPEGICVGFPIYYATGNKWKAFGIAAASGLSEPVGGFIGWLLMKAMSGGGDISPLAYGIMFGIVAGMMVYIALAQLLPAAHNYDKDDKYVTVCATGGMAVMALSLCLFVGA